MNDPAALISVDPEIHFGKPCIAGTRITVANVLELIEAGVSMGEIMKGYYPDLNDEQIRACDRSSLLSVSHSANRL